MLPLPESNVSPIQQRMRFKDKGYYKVRILTYITYLQAWLPVIRYNEEEKKFYSSQHSFNFRYTPDFSAYKNLFGTLARKDVALRKEILGDVQEHKRSPFKLSKCYRAIGFNLSDQEDADPNVLAFFDFRSKLEQKFNDLTFKTKPNSDIIDMGPLWGYDIFIERKSTEKNDQDQWDVHPVNKISPFEGELTKSMMKNSNEFGKWYKSKDLSQFFNPEQMAALQDGTLDLHETIHSSLRYMSDEDVINQLAQTPINFNAPDSFMVNKPAFLPQTIEELTTTFTNIVEQRGLPSGNYYLLDTPRDMSEQVMDDEISTEEEPQAVSTPAPVAAQPVPTAPTSAPVQTSSPANVSTPDTGEDIPW